MEVQVFMYDAKCCRNCRDGHKYDDQQTCKHTEVIKLLRKNPPIGYDPQTQISVVDGHERAKIPDHTVCNFHVFRDAQVKNSYLETKMKIRLYSERVEQEDLYRAKIKAQEEVVEKFGIVFLQGKIK
jgi:hypothetical protein